MQRRVRVIFLTVLGQAILGFGLAGLTGAFVVGVGRRRTADSANSSKND